MSIPARTYQLIVELRDEVRCRVGKLGVFDFPRGRYVYTGSAKANLQARIDRHLRREKRFHWHIDYLLARPEARIVRVLTSGRSECALNRSTAGRVLVGGFGASDCRSGCGAHLKFLGAR